MAPTSSKFGSLRSRFSRPNVLSSSFKEDNIVAFQYENTVAAAPPIPVGPSKTSSPSRSPSSASSALPPSFSFSGSPPQPPTSSVPPSPFSTSSFTAGPSSPRYNRPLTRSSSVSMCSVLGRTPSRPASSVSTLHRNPSTIVVAVAASRNALPPPPVEEHPLFRDNNTPISFSFTVPTVPELLCEDFVSGPNLLRSSLGITQSNSTRSISTAGSRDRSDSFWRHGSSVAGTVSPASTICEGSINEKEEHTICRSPVLLQRKQSKKRRHALISSFSRTPGPLKTVYLSGIYSAPVSPVEKRPFDSTTLWTVPSSSITPSEPVFGPISCVPLQSSENINNQDQDTAAMPPPSAVQTLSPTNNTIVVDSRLSVDFRPISDPPSPIPEHVAADSRPGTTSPAFGEGSSHYSTAHSHTMTSESEEPAEKRIKLSKSFSIRVKNRFRRRTPTVPTQSLICEHESAMTSVTSSVSHFSLSATRPTTGTGVPTSGSHSTASTTPTRSSFLGVSRLSLLVGGSRSRPQTAQAPHQIFSGSSSTGNHKFQQGQGTSMMPASHENMDSIVHNYVPSAEQGPSFGATNGTRNSTNATCSHRYGEMNSIGVARDPCNTNQHAARVGETIASATATGAPSVSGSSSFGTRPGPAARAQSQFHSQQVKVQAQYNVLNQQKQWASQESWPHANSHNFSSSFPISAAFSEHSSFVASKAPPSPTSRSPAATSCKSSLLPFPGVDRSTSPYPAYLTSTSLLPTATPASSFSTSLFSTTTTAVHHANPLPSLSFHRQSHAAAASRLNRQVQSQQPPQTLPASASSSSRLHSSRAHHVSLPPSANKNFFSIDFGNFSVDDLVLITDFESRPLPDLRLSTDIVASPVNTSSIPAPLLAPQPPNKSKTFALSKKSRESFAENIWPCLLSKIPTVENNAHLTQPAKLQAPTDGGSLLQGQSSAKANFSLLAIDIPSNSLVEHEFLTGFQFSKRGSVILDGRRVIPRSALDEYLKSTPQQDPVTKNTIDNSASQEAVLSSIESATADPSATTAGTGTTDKTTDNHTRSRSAFIVSDCSLSVSIPTPAWERPPILRKTSPTPSPSLASLLSPRLSREPTYDLIDILHEQLGEHSDHAKSDQNDDPPPTTPVKSNKDKPQANATPTRPSIGAERTSRTMTSSPTDLLQPSLPDLEQESHKVRSLYETGETICWEDGAPSNAVANSVGTSGASASTERLSPMPEAPEETENALVTPVTNSLAPAWNTPRSISSSASQGCDSSSVRREFELAGGLEDWQDVNSHDVDRYGFINPKSSDSRLSTPTEVRQQQMQNGRARRVLSKKDTFGSSLHSHSYLGRKMSARSLNTQASEVSAISWRSTRSVARQAANMLPVNRERRWMDEAGDMLTLAPGISDISDDAEAGRITESIKRKEWQRIEKWRRMATINNLVPGQGQQYEFNMKDPKLIERTWKGIPDCWRAAAWYSFLTQSARESGTAASEASIVSSFHALQTKPSIDDVQIDLDVPRTISRHIMFRRRYRGGQRLLFRVLHALALYFPEVGYVQGMASLAATLLSYFDEEKAFVMLVRLWTLRGLARLYSPGFEGLMDSLRELEGVWLAGKPVHKKMTELCIDPTAYGTRWYLTLFNLSIPFGAQLRIWDIFMLLGAPAVEGPLPPPPSAAASIVPSNGPHRSAISLLPVRSKASPPGTSYSAHPPPSRLGTSASGHGNQIPSDGLQVLHAAAAALIQALSDVILDSDFENAMKALTSWIPVKDEDMLMRVTMAEYKTHYLNRKKRRLL